jgi:Homeodomain-like domain
LADSGESAMLRGTRRCAVQKIYVVRLTDQERVELRSVVKKLKGTSEKVRRAQILLKADADGPNWTDKRIAEAFSCQTRTVERLRQRLVERGFEETLHRVERAQPPVEKLLTGEQEARIIATRLGPPPKGYANWSLRLLARKVVELKIVDTVSHETVRRTLKKTG